MAGDRVEAVERALKILNCFNKDKSSLSLKELAEATNFYKSTILRLAGSLERYGFLVRQENGLYHLGPALIGLGDVARRSYDLSTTVRPVLEELRDRFNESTAFYIRSGDKRICLYRANANRAIHHHLKEGQLLPLERGAAGRVLLAYSGAAGELYTTIRAQGWYTSMGERDHDVGSVAVPLLTHKGEIHAVLAISGLISRFTNSRCREFAAALQEKASELSNKLNNETLAQVSNNGTT